MKNEQWKTIYGNLRSVLGGVRLNFRSDRSLIYLVMPANRWVPTSYAIQ